MDLVSNSQRFPYVDLIIGNMNLIDTEDRLLRYIKYVRPTYSSLLAEGMVLTNQPAFWRRRVHDEIGYMDEKYDCGFDYQWFLRLLKQRQAAHVNKTWGGLRLHSGTKTANRPGDFDVEYRRVLEELGVSVLAKHFHLLRRMGLMLMQGSMQYVWRGLLRRISLWS